VTSCLKCGRPVSGSGKVAHLLCRSCRVPKQRVPVGGKTHVVPDRSIRTLCGRPVGASRTAVSEGDATCQRCQYLLQVRARNQAYKVALRMAAMATADLVTKGDPDHLLCDALTQIAQLQARVIGPEILKRAAARRQVCTRK